MIGTISLPLVPLRKSDSEHSEMTSQLLFGEQVEILDTREKWLFVRNIADNYSGWVDRKMINLTSENTINDSYCISLPIIKCSINENNETVFLVGGSKISKSDGNEVIIEGKTFYIDPKDIWFSEVKSGEIIVSIAKQYLNAPYLWGGKTIMGIDCSGFVQVIYDICGVQLPRDASQQVEYGNAVNFLTESQAGDLAFFENMDGKITHVGMMLNTHQIIHASGWVKIENIDDKGIISNQTGEYSHKLNIIKRII